MSRRTYFLVSAFVFLLVACFHLARIGLGWSVQVTSWSLPMWPSWIALIITAALAYFGFTLARRS